MLWWQNIPLFSIILCLVSAAVCSVLGRKAARAVCLCVMGTILGFSAFLTAQTAQHLVLFLTNLLTGLGNDLLTFFTGTLLGIGHNLIAAVRCILQDTGPFSLCLLQKVIALLLYACKTFIGLFGCVKRLVNVVTAPVHHIGYHGEAPLDQYEEHNAGCNQHPDQCPDFRNQQVHLFGNCHQTNNDCKK